MKKVIQELVAKAEGLKAEIEAVVQRLQDEDEDTEDNSFEECLNSLDDAVGSVDLVASELRTAVEAFDE